MEGKCCSRASVLLSILALVIALCTYFYPKKSEEKSSFTEEQMKGVVIGVIRDNPQLVMDAMGEGMAKKRDESIKQLAVDIATNKDSLSKMGMKFGDSAAKVSIIAFIDPLCKHCMEFQKEIVKVISAKKSINFALLPVSVLGDDSITLGKVYYAVFAKSAEKALNFIDYVVNSKDPMDKEGIEKALKSVDLSTKEIEVSLKESDEKLIANGKKAEELRIPVVPAVFAIIGKEAQMIQNPTLDVMVQIAESGSLEQKAVGGVEEEK